MRRLWLALLLAAEAAAAPLGPGDRASVETLLAGLAADPFADEPLHTLERIYDRGPGRAALMAETRKRVAASTRLADLVLLGRLELDRGKRADGVKLLGQAVGSAQDPTTLRRLGLLLDDGGDRAGAIRAYRAGLSGANPIERRALQLRLGALLLSDGKTADARAVWDEAKRQAPADQALRRQIAEALASRGAYREAVAELKEIEPLLAQEPTSLITVLRREAELARRAGDRALAGEQLLRAYGLTAATRQVPLRGELTLELFRLYRADRGAPAKERTRGLVELERVARRAQPTEASAGALVGDVLAARGDSAGALAAFRALLVRLPSDVYSLRRLCALETGEERIRSLQSLWSADRSDATVGLDLITALFEAKRSAEAVRQARALRDRFPDNPLLLAEAGRLLSRGGEHAEALAFDERVLQLDPRKPEAALAYGDELRQLGRTDEAIKAYWKLVENDPSPTSYRHLLEVLRDRKLGPQIRRAYEEALAHAPDDHGTRRDFARWLGGIGELAAAIDQWKQIQNRSKDPFLREFAERELQRLKDQQLLNR